MFIYFFAILACALHCISKSVHKNCSATLTTNNNSRINNKQFSIFTQEPTGGYTRSGPTYDQMSLYSTDDNDSEYASSQGEAAGSSWQFQTQSSRPPQPSSGFGVGRGRGRGRGSVQANQPLRRPNFPGVAEGGTAGSASKMKNNLKEPISQLFHP